MFVSAEAGMIEFKDPQFDRSVILLVRVRWSLANGLSFRTLEEMMAVRGVAFEHLTIHRWVVRYSRDSCYGSICVSAP
jgi:transposase-like protein